MRHDGRIRHPSDQLELLLPHYKTIGSSTSGLEGTFSVFKRILGEHRVGAEELIEESHMRVIFCDAGWQREVCTMAAKIRTEVYPKSRARTTERNDKGVGGKLKTVDMTPFDDSMDMCSAELQGRL